jgi:hypothetical protein
VRIALGLKRKIKSGCCFFISAAVVLFFSAEAVNPDASLKDVELIADNINDRSFRDIFDLSLDFLVDHIIERHLGLNIDTFAYKPDITKRGTIIRSRFAIQKDFLTKKS